VEFHEPPMREAYPIAGVAAAGLRKILFPGNLKLHEASACREARVLLRDESVPALPCERDHADGNWTDLLKAAARLPAPSNLIVFSRLAGEPLWARVLTLGGLDLRITPFEQYIKETITLSLRRLKVVAIDFTWWTTFENAAMQRDANVANGKGFTFSLAAQLRRSSLWECGYVASSARSAEAAAIGECPDCRTNGKVMK